MIGSFLGLCGSVWVLLGQGDLFLRYYLYLVAALLGSGSSTMLVTVLSITADMIGSNIECAAFVYGLLSFTDKLSNGLAVMLIQYLTPNPNPCDESKNYFRYVVGCACGGSVILGVAVLLSMVRTKIGEKRCSKG
ncbi:UNVERIFIED_CONTAM: hypothetical protein GTU68_062947, partial [Idotea baltica]|nr:hypothetical protein [Idotea baltica]